MELIDKANILSEFYGHRDDEVWLTFFDKHEEGVLAGYLVSLGSVMQLSADAENKMTEAYDSLLVAWEAPEGEYKNLRDIIFAPFIEDEDDVKGNTNG